MAKQDPIQAARMLIGRHGPRAGAVAQEYASEAQAGSNTAALAHWSSVQSAIMELRRTALHAAGTKAH